MSTFEQVKQIIAENLNVDEGKVALESSILEDLGADSLDVMETVMALEESFNIKFSENEVKELKTVSDLVTLIDGKK